MTSSLLHSLQPPASKPSNLSPSARPAIASLWGLGLPYLSYLGDWQTYVLWYIIYWAWLELPFPLKTTKAGSYSCLDLPCHSSSEAILEAVFLSCSMTFANKIDRASSIKQKMLCFYNFFLFFIFLRTEDWNPLLEFLQFLVLTIARNRRVLPKAAKSYLSLKHPRKLRKRE